MRQLLQEKILKDLEVIKAHSRQMMRHFDHSSSSDDSDAEQVAKPAKAARVRRDASRRSCADSSVRSDQSKRHNNVRNESAGREWRHEKAKSVIA